MPIASGPAPQTPCDASANGTGAAGVRSKISALMKGALVFTTHALRRMLKHGIRSGQIREVLEKGERIESYPDDTPLPSYLMLGTGEGRVLHVVAADDEAQDETMVITSYEPDPNEWESDCR